MQDRLIQAQQRRQLVCQQQKKEAVQDELARLKSLVSEAGGLICHLRIAAGQARGTIMAQTVISVTLNGQSYQMGCDEGSEDHILALAADVDSRLQQLKSQAGQVPESWLLAIVSIMMADSGQRQPGQPANSPKIDTNAIAEKIEQAAMRINTITATHEITQFGLEVRSDDGWPVRRAFPIPGTIIFCRELPLIEPRLYYRGAHLFNRSQRMKHAANWTGCHHLISSPADVYNAVSQSVSTCNDMNAETEDIAADKAEARTSMPRTEHQPTRHRQMLQAVCQTSFQPFRQRCLNISGQAALLRASGHTAPRLTAAPCWHPVDRQA